MFLPAIEAIKAGLRESMSYGKSLGCFGVDGASFMKLEFPADEKELSCYDCLEIILTSTS